MDMKKEYDFSKGRRGAVLPTPAGKTRITIRLDSDILEWFREKVTAQSGGSYQKMINNVLREYVLMQESEPIEDVLRRVVREELHSLAAV